MPEPEDHDWLRQGNTSPEDVAKSYEDWAPTYDKTLAEWDYRAPADAAALLKARVRLDAEILDSGCGTGLTGAALRRAGFTGPIDGLDLSPSSLVEAAKRNVYRSLNEADLQSLPLSIADNAYDALICIGVLTYVPDSMAVLREFARVVRPGGMILATQRDDLFRKRSFDKTVASLANQDIFGDTAISEPRPYLPDNPDFGNEIKVIYITMVASGFTK